MVEYLKVYNFNAFRCRSIVKIREFYEYFELYEPTLVFIQEINVASALKVFSDRFQVYINLEQNSDDGIGIVTLVRRNVKVEDVIIGLNGRIIGVKTRLCQFWNVYPKSGSGFKNQRELFFREELSNLMMNWKDTTEFIIQAGDHNCIHRVEDSLNNPLQHLQPGLIKHIKIHGLSDDFLSVHGNDVIMFSRITAISRTRIDYVFSNTNKCTYFQYLQMCELDHKAMFARYEILLQGEMEKIPRNKFVSNWVISRQLEYDEDFLDSCKVACKEMKREFESCDNPENDPSFFWLKLKTAIIGMAKEKEREIKLMEKQKYSIMMGFYSSILFDIQNGRDCYNELDKVRKDMDNYYNTVSKNKIDKMRCKDIDDHVYDIHKLQDQKKYENQKRISELEIEGIRVSGTVDVVKAIENKMQEELAAFEDMENDHPPTMAEREFLEKIKRVDWTDEEREKLIGPTNEEEISEILKYEVDLDSSPGEDGITYRFISIFWKWQEYRFLYLKFLNFTRNYGSWGLLENCGIMTIINKKTQSNLYEKKRKLTKVNKESNLGNGKVWTNRLKQVVIPKVLPKVQFNCQDDVNIIDELIEIRNVNQYLITEQEKGTGAGTILSLDFKDAFRSMSHRWFNLVMEKLGFPTEFRKWFWMMYRDLYIIVVLNKCRSEPIFVKRGFMEGHSSSMAAFVVALIPVMKYLEEKLDGILIMGKTHKIKMFADDMKVFLQHVDEVKLVEKGIQKFEKVSGLILHRDPSREKCQALPFGEHREFKEWPTWITVKSKIKIVGGIFSNTETFEKVNSDLVSRNFFNGLQKAYGMRGTVLQKAYYVNTYLFSKLWFTSQFCKIDQQILKNILSRAMKFIYAGENERPVNSVNFRKKLMGGLGVYNPIIKCKALLLKSMYKEYTNSYGNIDFANSDNKVYGYWDEFQKVCKKGVDMVSCRSIYDYLLEEITHRNGELIPSRNEFRLVGMGINWDNVYRNFQAVRGITPIEKCFYWKVTQDMLNIGARLHRQNADKRCKNILANGEECQELQNMVHLFQDCPEVNAVGNMICSVLDRIIGKRVDKNKLIYLDFRHSNIYKVKCGLWFAVKALYKIYQDKCLNKAQLLKELLKELDWNINMGRKVGSSDEMFKLREILIGEGVDT